MNYPQPIKELIGCLKKLPGIGEKTAERLALSILEMDNDVAMLFSKSIVDVKEKITRCSKCNNLAIGDLCEICKDESRNKKVICVLEEPKNVAMFEKMGTYHGLYHVLGGLISPLDGINPEDLSIDKLIKRIEEENIEEIIVAVKPSIEGETTTLYLQKKLEGLPVTISKIARGLPIGADIDYVDPLTLEMALEDRIKISNS